MADIYMSRAGHEKLMNELKMLEQQLAEAKSQSQKINSIYDSVKAPN